LGISSNLLIILIIAFSMLSCPKTYCIVACILLRGVFIKRRGLNSTQHTNSYSAWDQVFSK
jgi:hypothetical protein